MLAEMLPQRWGVGSTRLHLDLEELSLGVLLFDRLVLPTPSDVAEADRWDQLGWDTKAHAKRIVQLGELVHFAPWAAKLRDDWRSRWEQLKRIGQESRQLAYSITPMVIAQSAWQDVMNSADGANRPAVRPVPVVWSPNSRKIVRTGQQEPRAAPTAPYQEVIAIKFRRILEHPSHADPEGTLNVALTLANTPDFQAARLALYQAEAFAAAGQLTPQDLSTSLDTAVAHYNEIVAAHAGATKRRVIHHVLPFVAGQGMQLTRIPGAAAAGRWSVKKIIGRLIPLPPAPHPGQHAGSALALVEQSMSVIWADRASPRTSQL